MSEVVQFPPRGREEGHFVQVSEDALRDIIRQAPEGLSNTVLAELERSLRLSDKGLCAIRLSELLRIRAAGYSIQSIHK